MSESLYGSSKSFSSVSESMGGSGGSSGSPIVAELRGGWIFTVMEGSDVWYEAHYTVLCSSLTATYDGAGNITNLSGTYMLRGVVTIRDGEPVTEPPIDNGEVTSITYNSGSGQTSWNIWGESFITAARPEAGNHDAYTIYGVSLIDFDLDLGGIRCP